MIISAAKLRRHAEAKRRRLPVSLDDGGVAGDSPKPCLLMDPWVSRPCGRSSGSLLGVEQGERRIEKQELQELQHLYQLGHADLADDGV